jgi:hypothetical protein
MYGLEELESSVFIMRRVSVELRSTSLVGIQLLEELSGRWLQCV